MRRLLLLICLIPFIAYAAINDWSYVPFIIYSGQSPDEVIKQGRNFELLKKLWDKPQSFDSLEISGFEFADIDTTLLMRQGMVYCNNGEYHSAIPFIDSIAMNSLRTQANLMAKNIIEDTRPQMQVFLATLDSVGYRASAFPLVHSLVFDDIIWGHLNGSQQNSTICHTDSMTWNGVFYFFRPEIEVYGTNGMGLGDKHRFKFAWGENSNAYLCTVFIKTNIIKALKNLLKGEDLTPEMLQDCHKFGVLDENQRLTIPVLDGNDAISKSAGQWAKAAANSFMQHFDIDSVAGIIGLPSDKETAAKVILYHEILFEIDKILDETGLLPIPEILTSSIPADKKQTASVAYITTR